MNVTLETVKIELTQKEADDLVYVLESYDKKEDWLITLIAEIKGINQ